MVAASTEQPQQRTAQMIANDLHALLDQGVQFVRLGAKAGTYQSRRTKQGATHRLLTVPGSVLVEPLRKPRKNRRLPAPFQRYSEFNNDTMQEHFQIPAGATHVCYTTSSGRVEIIAQVSAASDFDNMRGTLRYGIYHAAGDRFQSLMPQDKADPYLENRDPTPCRCPIDEHRTMKAEVPVATVPAVPPAPKILTGSHCQQKIMTESEFAAHVKNSTLPKSADIARALCAPRAPAEGANLVNGVRKPGSGKTAQVWAVLDAMFAGLGRVPTKAELLASPELAGANPNMVGTNHFLWRKYYARA